MRRTPSAYLVLLVIAVPGMLVLVVLWPQIQGQIFKPKEVKITDVPIDPSPRDATPTPDGPTQDVAPTADAATMPVADQPSEVEKLVAENRAKLDSARASFDRMFQSIDAERLKKFGLQEWEEIQALVSQAERSPQPLVAVDRYENAESLLESLRDKLPNRQLLAGLVELKSQHDHLAFLQKLTEVSDVRPDLRDRLAPFWAEIQGWTSQQWLTIIRREAEDLSPNDGGFSNVYHALADFHRELGNEQAALDAEQVALDNAMRMTDATRAAQSAIRALQRLPETSPSSVRNTYFQRLSTLVMEIEDTHDRMDLLANLASLSAPSQRPELLDQIRTVALSSRVDLHVYWPAIYRCKVLAETGSPSEVFDVCASIPKYNGRIGFDPFAANTMGYAYAAFAAARANQRSAFLKAMLLAEAQQLDNSGVSLRDQRACALLASADLRQRNYRRVVRSAMNLEERSLRPPLLFPVMKDSPQDVPPAVARMLILQNGSDDMGCVSVASYMPTLANSFENEAEAVSWILGLTTRSVRIASLIGFARHCINPSATPPPSHLQPPSVDPTDPRALLEIAESETALMQLPLNRAWAYLWIAACWRTLDQPASYANALTEFDDALDTAWESHWQYSEGENRPSNYRNNRERDHELNRLIDCYSTAAELQAFVLNDVDRAVENILNAARASQPLNDGNAPLKMRLWLIAEAIHRECGIPPGTLDSVFIPPNNYYQMLLASRRQDLNSLRNAVQKIESQGSGKGFEAPDYLARAYAELAILCAKNGDVSSYRSFRRKSAGIITSRGSVDSIFLPLYEADAFAGEFSLAMSRNRRLDPLTLYGTSSRADAALCTQLSLASRTADAIKQLPTTSEPFYRLQAMHAVAACRSASTPGEQLVQWQDEQSEQLDRIAILCGLACKKPIP